MKNFLNIIAVLTCFHSSVSAYYLNDEKSKLGYIIVDNGGKNYPKYGHPGNQRKQFAVGRHYSNENIVDSHFKIKTVPYYMQSQNVKSEPIEVQNTEVSPKPKSQLVKDKKDTQQEKTKQVPQEKNTDKEIKHNQPKPRTMPDSRLPKRSFSPKTPVRHETKPSYVSMNINRATISTHPQKYRRLNSNRPLTKSYHRQDYQRIPTASLVDNFQQVTGISGNYQVMSRVLDDMTRNISDRRTKGEYKKRETDEEIDGDNSKRNVITDTIKKYIVGKDKTLNTERKNVRAKEYARIGSHEDVIDTEDNNPYAIFYRMHPDSLDDHEAYIPIASPTEEANMGGKKKRLSMNYDNNTKKTKFNSSLKMHKKVKNFSNYRFAYD